MIISTQQHGVSLRLDYARLQLEVAAGTSYADEDCLHLYFDAATVIKCEPGHITLRLKHHTHDPKASTTHARENTDAKI